MKILSWVSRVIAIFGVAFGLTGPISALAATDPGLGAAASFSVLGQTAITNVPVSAISGNVGLNNAGTNYSGLTSAEVAGTIYDTNGTGPDGAGAILNAAVQADASTAFSSNIPGQGTNGSIGPALDGLTVTPGVYDIGAGRLNGGILHLNGPGIYIFRASSDFISSGSISLENGARACDVYWRVATLATINGSQFTGTILAGTGVHFGANVALDGRALAVGGDVTMISNTISGPTCVVPPVTPTVSGGGSYYPPRIIPLIGILKVPTPLAMPAGPGSVTYDYTVWNVGQVDPLAEVSVADDKCGPVTLVAGGDRNGNRLLDISETWHYTCTANVATTTLNTAVATGYSNDAFHEPAYATALATVVVSSPLPPPLISVVKVPDRLTSFPYGGGDVTYTYTVTNPGVVAMRGVTLIDDKCYPPAYQSGDVNNDKLLDVGEKWVYTCRANVPVTTRNIATAKGFANGFTAVAYAYANVLVSGPPPVAPVPTPAPPTLPRTGYAPVESAPVWPFALVGLVATAVLLYVLRRKQSVQ